MFSKIADFLIMQIESGNLQWIKKLDGWKIRTLIIGSTLFVFFTVNHLYSESACIRGFTFLLLVGVLFLYILTNFSDSRIRTSPFRFGLYFSMTLLFLLFIGVIGNIFESC